MALNENIKRKIEEKTAGNATLKNDILTILKGVDENKQLKRIIDTIIKTK